MDIYTYTHFSIIRIAHLVVRSLERSLNRVSIDALRSQYARLHVSVDLLPFRDGPSRVNPAYYHDIDFQQQHATRLNPTLLC
jgi:hypothetical protein